MDTYIHTNQQKKRSGIGKIMIKNHELISMIINSILGTITKNWFKNICD